MTQDTTTIIVGGVVLKKDDKYLLVQEAKKHVYGKWNLPGGKISEGETPENAAVREAKEETGYDVEIIREVGVYHEFPEKAVKHTFEAKIIGGDFNYPKDELLDARWFSFNEIESMKENLRHPSVLEAITTVESSQ